MGVRRMTAAVVVESGDHLGECPVWDPGRSELLWTDIHGRRLHRLTADVVRRAGVRRRTQASPSPRKEIRGMAFTLARRQPRS